MNIKMLDKGGPVFIFSLPGGSDRSPASPSVTPLPTPMHWLEKYNAILPECFYPISDCDPL